MRVDRNRPLRIGVVAGEASGDILGAGLIRALRCHYPDIRVEGIGGPLMTTEGCKSFFPQDRLAVMGLIEPLKRLPELLRIRRFLKQYFLQNPPDVFIGIDSPDFNLHLETNLHQAGIKTVHYVSPSVWAWRRGRLKTIARAADVVLTLFPFEEAFYQAHAKDCPTLRAVCVGHPLADTIPFIVDQSVVRSELALSGKGRIIALLPGSRAGEVERMGKLFLDVARWCLQKEPTLRFVIPAANAARQTQLATLLAAYEDIPVTLIAGRSRECMAASDIVLMASGTTTLEAMLLKKPMVVAYKMASLSYAIISRLLQVPYISLPNLLANEALVPEFLQKSATVENLGAALVAILENEKGRQSLVLRFDALHHDLRREADRVAAQTVLDLISLA